MADGRIEHVGVNTLQGYVGESGIALSAGIHLMGQMTCALCENMACIYVIRLFILLSDHVQVMAVGWLMQQLYYQSVILCTWFL